MTLLDAGGSRTRSFTATEVFCWAFSLTRLSRFFEYRFSNLCDSRQLVSPVTIHCRELADTSCWLARRGLCLNGHRHVTLANQWRGCDAKTTEAAVFDPCPRRCRDSAWGRVSGSSARTGTATDAARTTAGSRPRVDGHRRGRTVQRRPNDRRLRGRQQPRGTLDR